MIPKHTNRLILESSPYLRQHAHNPVDWYPWGAEALQKAKENDLPILISIGYSACHWCHVMEHESFENEDTAAYMNQHFINIKIDREERPDLDHIYMEAVQAISGSGGWPLNVFLTPEKKPFYGGTYFPPEKAFNRASWKDILSFISESWKNKREDLLKQANLLVNHIQSSGSQLLDGLELQKQAGNETFTSADCKVIAENILNKADLKHGGFGPAPKFPQTFTIQYLLMYGYFFKHEKAIQHASFSIKQMLNGGIYDHLAGGMARYSTDIKWLAPHFEKMLYDNALLVTVLCDAYLITKDDFFKKGIEKTLRFIIKEMKHPDGGFYSALDADTEGVEGKFYVWDKKEIEEVIKHDSELCCEWYGVTEHGNWEEKNILHIHTNLETFAKKKNIPIADLEGKIELWNEYLIKKRNTRISPEIDDKILLGWNALLLTAFCKAYAALNKIEYKEEAIALYEFIIEKYKKGDGGYYHTYKNEVSTHPAFLDDYTYLVQSCINLQEITSDQKYLLEAREITEYILKHFSDSKTGLFFFTNIQQEDILLRKAEIYDGAVPSGNSIMLENLYYLAMLLDKREWLDRAHNIIFKLKDIILKYPTSFGIWASILLKQTVGIHEVVISGNNIEKMVNEFLKVYLPNRIFQSSEKNIDYPFLKNKDFEKEASIYLCKQYACSLPIYSISELKKTIN